MLTLGSLFDGIGGWLLAAERAGIRPVWASEIDEFPMAVTNYHFPEVEQLGDITKIDTDKIESVDVICAGSPCQSWSTAGKREGMDGASGLFTEATRVFHELRERTGKPRFFVWENVPGVFSSNHGQDFKTVLEQISKASVPMPEYGRWADAGVAELPSCQIAWKVLDARCWGVAQRRRRIFLVADFAADGRCAAEILFDIQGLQRNPEEVGEAGKESTSVSGSGSPTAGTGREVDLPDKTGTITARYYKGASTTLTNSPLVPDVFEIDHTDEPVRMVKGGSVNALKARMGTGGNQVPCVTAIAGNITNRKPANGGNGDGYETDGWCYTLTATDRHAVSGEMGVRKLTPLECERLQGLPDSYTDVPFKGKPAPDSRRYKAIGNGMAQPCADFIMRRLHNS